MARRQFPGFGHERRRSDLRDDTLEIGTGRFVPSLARASPTASSVPLSVQACARSRCGRSHFSFEWAVSCCKTTIESVAYGSISKWCVKVPAHMQPVAGTGGEEGCCPVSWHGAA